MDTEIDKEMNKDIEELLQHTLEHIIELGTQKETRRRMKQRLHRRLDLLVKGDRELYNKALARFHYMLEDAKKAAGRQNASRKPRDERMIHRMHSVPASRSHQQYAYDSQTWGVYCPPAPVKQGADLTTATWQVETFKQLKCRQCSQHDQSQEDLQKSTLILFELGGLRITGCFDTEKHAFDKKAAEEQVQERLKEAQSTAPQGEAAVKKELQDRCSAATPVIMILADQLQHLHVRTIWNNRRIFEEYGSKEVPETETKQLSIVPHYRIWDPKEHDDLGDLKQPRAEAGGYFAGQKLPWEGKERYLSARATSSELKSPVFG
eukprot:g30520.t1